MNTLLRTLLLSVVIIAQPALAFALVGGPTLSAQSFENTITVGSQFTVAVYLDTKTHSVTATELHLTFPADRLQAISVQPSSFLPNVLTAGATGSGTASITVGSGTQPSMGTGTIALVVFRALTTGPAQISFATTTQVAAVGQTGNAVDTLSPTTVVVAAAAAGTPTPIVTPTPTTIIGGAGAVTTGPGDSALMALIVAAIAVLAYAGYAGTDDFRRKEVQSIAASERTHPPDFRR